jgi:hypothetical protein
VKFHTCPWVPSHLGDSDHVLGVTAQAMFGSKEANQLKVIVSRKQVGGVLYPGSNRRGVTDKPNALPAQQMKVL